MFEWIVLGLLFLFVVGLSFSIYQWLLERRQRVEAYSASAEEPVGRESSLLILGELTPVLASQSPVSAAKRSALVQELREAGYYHHGALLEYQAVRAVLVLMPLTVAGLLALLAPRDDIPGIAAIGAVLAVLGFSLPRGYINYRARSRARQIERGLPVALDLLNLSLSGGHNMHAALASISKEIRLAYPVLAEELLIVREQAELSHLTLALQHFADRTNIPDVCNLAMVLAQTDRLGTDVSAGLLESANNLRMNMRHRAEAQANRANFWMLFPTILCLWIPAALLLFSPVYFEFVKKRDETQELFRTGRETLDRAGNPRPR